MSWSVVQDVAGPEAGGDFNTHIYNIAAPSPGNMLVVMIQQIDLGGPYTSISGGGVTWVKAVENSTDFESQIWYGVNSSGAGTTITIESGGTGSLNVNIVEFAWSEGATTDIVAVRRNTNQAQGTAILSDSITPPGGRDALILACMARNGAGTKTAGPTGGFTDLTEAGAGSRCAWQSVPSTAGSYEYGATYTNEFAVHNTCIAAFSLQRLADDLIAYWELDEASGTRNDAHGTNHLTDNNTVVGSADGGADFETDNSEYLSHASNSDLQIAGDMTVCAFVKEESVHPDAGGRMIVTKDDDASNSRDYTLDTYKAGVSNVRFYRNGGGVGIATSTQELVIGTPYFLVGRYDPTAQLLKVSIDAVTVDTTPFTAAPDVSSAEFRIGAREYAGFPGYFDGTIKKVGLWRRSLSDAEITDLYNGGAGRDYAYLSGLFDSSAGNGETGSGGTTLSWSHTIGNRSNRILFVAAQSNRGDNSTASGVTFNGMAMTKVAEVDSGRVQSLWRLANPPIGTYTVEVTWENTETFGDGASISVADAAVVEVDDATSTGSAAAYTQQLTTLTNDSLMLGFAWSGGGAASAGANTIVRASGDSFMQAVTSDGPTGIAGLKSLNYTSTIGTWIGTFAVVAPASNYQYARPSADISDGSWTPSAGSDLFATIDELIAADTDYNRSSTGADQDDYEVGLSDIDTPQIGEGTVRFRHRLTP